MAKELYVGHISEQATEEDLRKLFEVMGVVTSVHLIVDQDTGEFKRCGYVRMLSEVDLKEVVETLDGTWLIDRCIVVSIAKPQKDRPAKTPFVKRSQTRVARPTAAKAAVKSEQPAAIKSSKSARPAINEAAKTGRSSAAKEAARKYRPSVAKDAVKGERPAAAAKRSSPPTGGRKQSDRSAPSSKGRR
jgi:RNA recognition motif-containing protein